jgi:gliding motility-associated lipoprotein GldD
MLLLLVSCTQDYQPKPNGYFRIGLPGNVYSEIETPCPYSFEINSQAQWVPKNDCWANVHYPGLKADIQLTYKHVTSPEELEKILNESQDLAYKHTVKAEGIGEKLYMNSEKKVYGIFYLMAGNSASSAQFYMTDSTNHFLRGVLYFYSQPNADSLKPAALFMQSEMVHLVETLQWKNSLP